MLVGHIHIFMQILCLLVMCFDAAVVFVKAYLLLFRLALAWLAILWGGSLWPLISRLVPPPQDIPTPLFLM